MERMELQANEMGGLFEHMTRMLIFPENTTC